MPTSFSKSLRPRLRVLHKLFLLLTVLVVLALTALGGTTAYNLRRGFVAYINELDLARLVPLATALEQRNDARHGFTGLHDRAAWDALLRDTLHLKPPPRPHPHPSPPPPPPPPSADAPPPPVPLLPRISLLGAQHQWIVGPPPPANALMLPLRRDGRALGWLALRPLKRPAGSNEIDFLTSQLQELLWTGVMLLVLALVAAWVFARHLLAPLRAVERGAEQLAGGRYDVHLETTRRDELGDLVRHINRLGNALQAHETARRRWIADISHELRTPLAIVRGEIEAMREGIRPFDACGLGSLHEEVMRLNRLIEDLHELSMADLGTLSYRPQKIALADLLRDACARFESEARAAELTLESELAPVAVHADPDRARQLIDNLLRNSLRYTDPGGRIRVTCGRRPDGAQVTVEDSAPGVAADALPRLFDPLYRGAIARDRRRGGSGLGLAIAERIAKAHGGTLRALASPLGGLRIEWNLPAVDY